MIRALIAISFTLFPSRASFHAVRLHAVRLHAFPLHAVDTLTTRSGVFTTDQAEQGKQVYALICVTCHTPVSHTGPAFTGKWEGKSLWELLDYIRTSMPKSEPGSLSQREYLRVLAYLLRMNGMPTGKAELTADSVQLKAIRVDWGTARDTTKPR